MRSEKEEKSKLQIEKIEPKKEECWKRIITAIATCGSYLLVGPTLIVFNNKIMHEYGFSYPIILSSVGVISCAIVTHFLVDMGYCHIREDILKEFSGRKYWTHLAPVGACYCFALGLGNASYMYLGVGLVQMLKAFTPVTLLIILRASGVEIPTKQVIVSVLVIFIGTIITTQATPEFNLIGVLLMGAAEISEASRLVVMQHLLVGKNFSVVEAQYFIAPLTGLSMVILSAITELPRAIMQWNNKQASESVQEDVGIGELIFLFGLVAVLGIATNYLAYFVIRQTGSLTLKALATARNVGIVIYGAVALGEPFSEVELFGYSITLVGFIGYSYFKATQIRKEVSNTSGSTSSSSSSSSPSSSAGSHRTKGQKSDRFEDKTFTDETDDHDIESFSPTTPLLDEDKGGK